MSDNLEQELDILTAEINEDTENRQQRINSLINEYDQIDGSFREGFARDEAILNLAHEQALQESAIDVARTEAEAEKELDRAIEEESEEVTDEDEDIADEFDEDEE